MVEHQAVCLVYHIQHYIGIFRFEFISSSKSKSPNKSPFRGPKLHLWSLKAHWQISKKLCFEKYCSGDKACKFSALLSTPWQSCLEKSWQMITIYKQTSLTIYTSNDVSKRCWEEEIILT